MLEAEENYLDAAEAADAAAEAEAAFFFIGADAAGADAAAEAAGADAIAEADALAEAAGADAMAEADALAEAEADAEGAAVWELAKAEAANKPVTKTAINFFIFNPLKFELLSNTIDSHEPASLTPANYRRLTRFYKIIFQRLS